MSGLAGGQVSGLVGIDICPIPGGCQITNLGGDVASAAAGSVLQALNSAVQSAADWLVGHVMDLINTSTTPDLTAHWFTTEAALMEQVVVLLVLPILMAASIGPVLRQDLRRLGRVWGVGLPVAVIAGVLGPQLAGLAVAATDQLCAILIGAHSQQIAKQFSAAMSSNLVMAAPSFVQLILAGLTVAGTVLVWLELTVRDAAVYVATFFMPVALVGYIWPATAGMAKRAVEILASLVLSKFVIVGALTLGLAAAGGSGPDAAIAGAAILLLAGFAPFALLRLAPIVEASAVAHLEGLSRRPVRATARTATAAAAMPTHPIVQTVMSAYSRSRSGSDGAPAGTGPLSVSALHVQERPADFVMSDFVVQGAGHSGDRSQGLHGAEEAGSAGGSSGPSHG